MFEQFFKFLMDNMPTWFIVLIILFAGIMRFGPKFINQLISVGENYKDKSDKVKNEFIALLKSDKEKLEADLSDQINRNKILREKIRTLRENSKD